MSWQKDFEEFKLSFEEFSQWLNREELSEAEQEKLMANLNRTVELGWRTLQKFMHQDNYPTEEDEARMEAISKNGFASNLEALKETFERNEAIQLKHDRSFYENNEWEVREVIYPAFKDLYDFLVPHTS